MLHESVPSPNYWEVTAVPKAENDGNHELAVFYRFQQVLVDGSSGKLSLGTAVYFETYQYVAGAFTAEPQHFFDAMLAQRKYWDSTWKAEGLMRVNLPMGGATDGSMLLDQAHHGLVKDMITRLDTWWPRYGVVNEQGSGYGM